MCNYIKTKFIKLGKKMLFLLTFIFLINLNAQESNVDQNFQGKDYTQLKHAWTAQWVTHPTESTLDYGVFHFRKIFTVDKIPTSLIIYVSADNRYRLYVNGNKVCQGPALGDLNNYKYETLDISKYLVTGKNIIAAEVVNFGEYRKASQQTFQTAFILQSEKNESINLNTGNAEWKVIKNYSYQCIPFTSDSLQTYYAAGPCELIDAKIYPWGWETINFNDSNWLKPKKATVEFAVGRGFLYGSTWFLVPREIPFMEETKIRFSKIVQTNLSVSTKLFLEGEAPLIIPSHSKIKILFDQTFHTTGYPILNYSKGKNSKIKITYAETLIKDFDTSKPISDGNLLNYDLKGNRNDFSGKKIFGYYDIILPDGNLNRIFQPLSRRTYRFVELNIETTNEELILNDYYGIYTAYPFEEKAKFITEDLKLSKIWDASWRTLRNSAEESFFDPYYEQLQYVGDTRIESLVSVYVSGDDRLMRNAIKQFDDSRITEGLTQSRYPSYIVQVIPTYSLLWIGMINDFLMYRNDPQFIKQFLPGMKSVLNWFEEKIDSTGMITNLEWWNFTDWADGFPNGIPPGADNGYSANISFQFVYALQNAIQVFKYFNYQKEANHYLEISEKVQAAVTKKCYDNNRKLISETPDKSIFSQHTNIFAILTNTVKESEHQELINKILEDKSLIQTTIYFKFYLFRALQKAGLGNKYFDLLYPWINMLNAGMTTFGETDVNPRSDCHAWSASPCFDFLHLIAGIYPAETNFRKVIIQPNFGPLTKINVEFPHPDGIIKVDLDKENERIIGSIHFPKSLIGFFIYNNKKIELKQGINLIDVNN